MLTDNLNDLTDLEAVVQALRNWANYIETGDISMNAQDVAQRIMAYEGLGNRERFGVKHPPKLKALNTEQMRFIVRLRDLADNADKLCSMQRLEGR